MEKSVTVRVRSWVQIIKFMNQLELNEKFRKVLYAFAKENNLKLNDKQLIKVLRDWYESLVKDYKLDNHNQYLKDYKKGDNTFDKLNEFHNFIVNQCIKFILENENVAKMIEDKKNEVLAKSMLFNTDIRVNFCIDNLDCSIKEQEWSPCSDSCLSISVGNINVIERHDVSKVLEVEINRDFETNIIINENNIKKFKSQFY